MLVLRYGASTGRRWIHSTDGHTGRRFHIMTTRRSPKQAVVLICFRVLPRRMAGFLLRKEPWAQMMRPSSAWLSGTRAKSPHVPSSDGVREQVGPPLLEVALCPLLHHSPPPLVTCCEFEHIESGSLRKTQQALEDRVERSSISKHCKQTFLSCSFIDISRPPALAYLTVSTQACGSFRFFWISCMRLLRRRHSIAVCKVH